MSRALSSFAVSYEEDHDILGCIRMSQLVWGGGGTGPRKEFSLISKVGHHFHGVHQVFPRRFTKFEDLKFKI